MTKTLAILLGGAFLATAAIAAQTAAQTPAASPKASPTPEFDNAAITRGAQAWADHCGRCHNFRSPDELDAELWDVSVTHMRVRGNLPGSVARDVKAFLMSNALAKQAYPAAAFSTDDTASASYAYLAPGDAARGKQVYEETCFACHGLDGKGVIEGVPDFTAKDGRLAKTDNLLLSHMINGFQSEGSPMPMPAFGGNPNLTEQDMADTLAYLRKEFQKKP